MTSPWGAILAGLGRGSSALGESLETKDLLRQQRQRQAAQDALAELGKFQDLGASDVTGQTDPLAALRLSQLDANSPSAAITGGPSLTSQRDQQRQFGDAKTIQIPGPDGKMRTILLDPSTSKDARTEQRQLTLAEAATKRAEALERMKENAPPKTLLPGQGVRNTQGGYDIPVPLGPKAPLMGDPKWLAAQEAAAKIRAKYAPQAFTFPVGADPSGTPVIMRGNTKTGAIEPTGQAAKPDGSANDPEKQIKAGRITTATADMEYGHNQMQDYEKKLRSGEANLNGVQQFLGSVGNSFTHDDPVSRGVQTAALTALGTTNPDLARYIRGGLAFAEGESMFQQRPSDYRTKLAAFLSTASPGSAKDPGWLGLLDDVERRRTSILTPLLKLREKKDAGGQPTPNRRAGDKAITQAEWDAVKATGVDPAKHGYTVRP